MRMNPCVTAAVLLVGLASLLGCEKAAPPPAASTTTTGAPAATTPQSTADVSPMPSNATVRAEGSANLGQMLADLDVDRSRAATGLLQADWSKGDAMFAGTNLAMSEAEFIRQTAQEQQRLSAQNIKDMTKVRELVRAVIDAGQKAADQGDRAQAEKCFRAVLSLGETLSAPERMTIVQAMGKAVKSLAQKHLDVLLAR